MGTPDPFISRTCFVGFLDALAGSLSVQIDDALVEPTTSLASFAHVLALLAAALRAQAPPDADADGAAAAVQAVVQTLLPDLFVLAQVVGRAKKAPADPAVVAAQQIWAEAMRRLPEDSKTSVLANVKSRLREIISEPNYISMHDLFCVFSEASSVSSRIDALDVLPSRENLDNILHGINAQPLDPSLAVTDALVPPSTAFSERAPQLTFDAAGLSSYARTVWILQAALSENRQLAKSNTWALRHIMALSLYAADRLQLPLSEGSSIFSTTADPGLLRAAIAKAKQISAYLLTGAPTDAAWHADIVTSAGGGKAKGQLGAVGELIVDLLKGDDSPREARVLNMVLEHVLPSIEKSEADLWMGLAKTLEKTAPELSLSVVHSITQFAPEPPRLDRYRNELAANMAGIPARRANTDGLLALRRLSAAAPALDSDVVFMPQQRAVQLVKACQAWIASDDEELDEEVESAMTVVFLHLVPILQGVPGSHWDLIFDVLETNFESSSFLENETLVMLARSLRLVSTIQDFCVTNKVLREKWQERASKFLTAIRDLTAVKLDGATPSMPRSAARELALAIIQDLPPSLIDQDTLPAMCHLIMDSSVDVQKMAYQLMHGAALKRTEFVVVEAGVDSEGSYKAQLPMPLIDLLSKHVDVAELGTQTVFGYLLGWMLLFDLFTDASIKVKSGYSEHLRDLDIVSSHLLPAVYAILDVYNGARKAFKLEMWSVDEYYLQLFDPEALQSIPLLAAHVYYRALLAIPSLIRGWLDSCKDRQLYNAVTSYTSLHFSPSIISAELAQVRDPDAMSDLLSDENLAIKVAGSVNEVTASYTVDEQQLELTLKLPVDWPLHDIELRDNKKIGVPDDRWRAWVLGVRQIIWSQNGTLVDGLTLFKRNVSLHFEGMVECAICYSIIGVTDGSLPKKPCRTCKNCFHSSCLFKWFNSSHSSSCPLCRSEIL